MNTIFLNNQFLPADEARVSVLDRGFIFGDGVYEVIPVYGGKLFRLEQHLDRLDNSLISIRIPPPLSHDRWERTLKELVAKNGNGDQSVYIQITRGVAPRDHGFPDDIKPTIMAMSSELKPVSADLLGQGVGAITLNDFRWEHCNIKAIALLANILARQQALDVNASEAILIRDGFVTEGAASNVFTVNDREITTPPASSFLLPGITRDLVMELAAANHIACREAAISADDLAGADEIWLTSSTKEILPVTLLNNRKVGNGKPGPIWSRMLALYQDYKQHIREHGEDAA
jgi:D-alanine transaminase